MFLRNDKTISIGEDGKIGKIENWKDADEEEQDEDIMGRVKNVETQWIKIKGVTNKEGEFGIEYEEISEEEAQRIKKNSDYIDELAEALKDKLDSKELLKDALSEYPPEERKEMLEELEDGDAEVENEGGCHKLTFGDKELMVRA